MRTSILSISKVSRGADVLGEIRRGELVVLVVERERKLTSIHDRIDLIMKMQEHTGEYQRFQCQMYDSSSHT